MSLNLMWTKLYLQKILRERLADYLLITASNRQPYRHALKSGKVVCQREPGGLVTALDPVMQAVQGVWVAAGGSIQDLEVLDGNHKVMVPADKPSYSLRRIALSKEEMDHYYFGYSNEGLWPLSHIAYTRPHFDTQDWETYQKVNYKFAEAIRDEAQGRKAFVWVQDFHLTLVAKYLKELGCSNIITSLFWHIPWPNPEVFRICPQKKEILEGLMAYDLLGFHTRYHCDNFLATVDREIECRIDREKISINSKDHETLVRAFPISIDFDSISKKTELPGIEARQDWFRQEYNLKGKKLILGVDRIDYTKGLPDKFRAIDRMLEKHPELKGTFVLFQLGQVSRIHIPRYKQLNDEMNALVEQINWKHSLGSWSPIVLTRAYFSYDDILALYRMADLCVVSSLHDGMNLVAKEYAAARGDNKGVLILSQFTGAARELEDALLYNPYDSETFSETLAEALAMPEEEQIKRMQKMRAVIAKHNIYRWAGKVLSELLKFEFQED